ncbi:MAG: hypothetical protein AAFR83_13480 [Cyanobacteria bacterium J06629_18]
MYNYQAQNRKRTNPPPYAFLTGIYDEEGEPVIDQKVTIPTWMRPEKLAEILGCAPNNIEIEEEEVTKFTD